MKDYRAFSHLLCAGLLVLASTAGCRLDPDSLLGRSQEMTSDYEWYQTCRSKSLKPVFWVDGNACPGELPASDSIVGSWMTLGKRGMRLFLQKVGDGLLVGVREIRVRAMNPATGWIALKCTAAENASESFRSVDCTLPKEGTTKGETYLLESIELYYEKCNGSMVYRAEYLDDRCRNVAGSGMGLEIRSGTSVIPSVYEDGTAPSP